MAKAANRVLVTLECTDCRNNSETSGVSRYASSKNRRNTAERIELKKYCKFERKHTVHKEIR